MAGTGPAMTEICLTRRLQDLPPQAIDIGDLAALDADQFGFQRRRDRPAVAVGDGKVALCALDLADRRDDRGRAGGKPSAQATGGGAPPPLVDRIAFLAHDLALAAR